MNIEKESPAIDKVEINDVSMEKEADADANIVQKKRKTLEKFSQQDNDDGYVRPDKCELCGISFLGTHASQWNRYNIKVHINSRTCQNNQKKNLKKSKLVEGDNEANSSDLNLTKTPKSFREKQTKTPKSSCLKSKTFEFVNERDSETNDMIMLEIICGHVFFQVQDFLEIYKKQTTKNIDVYERGKDLVLKIVSNENSDYNQLNDNEKFSFSRSITSAKLKIIQFLEEIADKFVKKLVTAQKNSPAVQKKTPASVAVKNKRKTTKPLQKPPSTLASILNERDVDINLPKEIVSSQLPSSTSVVTGRRKAALKKTTYIEPLSDSSDIEGQIGLDQDDSEFTIDEASQSSGNSSYTLNNSKFQKTSLQKNETDPIEKSNIELQAMKELKETQAATNLLPIISTSTSNQTKPRPKRKIVRRNRIYKSKHIEYTSDRKKIFKCNRENCKEGFPSRNELRQHKKLQHATEKKTFFCDQCEYKCYTNCGLIVHKRKHTGERPYSCEHCGKSFTEKSIYQKHLLIHVGEKQICEICGIGCSTSSTLLRHMKIRHKDGLERKHVCTICGSKFYTAYHLTRHIRSHTGEKHYKCDICGKGYSNRIDLTRHVKNIHNAPNTTQATSEISIPSSSSSNQHLVGLNQKNSFNSNSTHIVANSLPPNHLNHHHQQPHHNQFNGPHPHPVTSAANEINLVDYAYDFSGINNFQLYQF